jgi:hypothetical protein
MLCRGAAGVAFATHRPMAGEGEELSEPGLVLSLTKKDAPAKAR